MLNRRASLPFKFSLGAFVLYLATLSWGISQNSLGLAAKVAGWSFQPMAGQPVLWLLTLPLHILPASWVPVGLNLLSAVLGSFTLGVLAHSVQLIPRDERSRQSSKPWASALPVILACVVCALQFSFWRDATSATGEMLDVLLLALTIACVMEYHAAKNLEWLARAAFFWALSVAENPPMVLTLPLVLVVLMLMLREKIINGGLWVQMILFATAGLCVWFLQPIGNAIFFHSSVKFTASWGLSFQAFKNVFSLYHQVWQSHRTLTLAIVGFYLLTTIPCFIRNPVKARVHKSIADQLQSGVYKIAQILILGVCAWLALEPTIGPHQLLLRRVGLPSPLLSFDYLDALGIGFLSGAILGNFRSSSRNRERSDVSGTLTAVLCDLAVPAMTLGLAVMVFSLFARNISAIISVNRYPLTELGRVATRSLPPGGGVLLSDDAQALLAFQAVQPGWSGNGPWLAVDTKALPAADYRASLERQRPMGWVTAENKRDLTAVEVLQLLSQVGRSNRVFYLHPSFGYFFERFYAEPAGAVYELKPLPKFVTSPPPLETATIASNEEFWNTTWKQELSPLTPDSAAGHSAWSKAADACTKWFHLSPQTAYQQLGLAEWYSGALNNWGVTLQRNHQYPMAHERFKQARSLSTNNISALFNLESNTNLLEGTNMTFAGLTQASNWIGNDPAKLALVMRRCGPFDHPVFCYLLGGQYQKSGMIVQAIQQFERVCAFVPDSPAPQFSLAMLYSSLRLDDKVFETTATLRKSIEKYPPNENFDLDIAMLEFNSWLSRSNAPRADELLQSLIKKYPDSDEVLSRVIRAYMAYGGYTNAAPLIERQLAAKPDDLHALMNQAALSLATGQPSNALTVLNRTLTITNLPEAKLSRAMAYIGVTNLDAAEADYHDLEKVQPGAWPVSLGLSQIAQLRHDTNLAVQYLQRALTNVPPGSRQWVETRRQMEALKPGSVTAK